MKIVITGGASGLGEAITRRFAAEGDNTVFFTYNTSADKARNIGKEFKNIRAIHCDFNDSNSVLTFCKSLEEMDPDLLIHNAFQGKFIDTYFHKTDLEDFEASFQRNVLPVISITKACLAVFRKKKSGTILTVLSSVLEEDAPVGSSVYTATKGFLAELVKSWSLENKKFNIISGAVSPGLMITALTKQLDERLLEQLKESNPGQRLLSTDETAEHIFQLIKDPTKINGKNIKIDFDTLLK